MNLSLSLYDRAVSNFCLELALENNARDGVVCALVGEELEWCGAHSYIFMASRYVDTMNKLKLAEERCEEAEKMRKRELESANGLRKGMKAAQLSAEDNEWQFREQLAHAANLLSLEKQNVKELSNEIRDLKGKLVEVEMYLDGNQGKAAIDLEEQLAAAKLRIAAMEAEKDEQLINGGMGGGVSSSSYRQASSPLRSNVLQISNSNIEAASSAFKKDSTPATSHMKLIKSLSTSPINGSYPGTGIESEIVRSLYTNIDI